MSGTTVDEPDTDKNIEEFKLEPADTHQHLSEYKGDQCEFVAQLKAILFRHKKLKHDKIKRDQTGKYICDQCD